MSLLGWIMVAFLLFIVLGIIGAFTNEDQPTKTIGGTILNKAEIKHLRENSKEAKKNFQKAEEAEYIGEYKKALKLYAKARFAAYKMGDQKSVDHIEGVIDNIEVKMNLGVDAETNIQKVGKDQYSVNIQDLKDIDWSKVSIKGKKK